MAQNPKGGETAGPAVPADRTPVVDVSDLADQRGLRAPDVGSPRTLPMASSWSVVDQTAQIDRAVNEAVRRERERAGS